LTSVETEILPDFANGKRTRSDKCTVVSVAGDVERVAVARESDDLTARRDGRRRFAFSGCSGVEDCLNFRRGKGAVVNRNFVNLSVEPILSRESATTDVQIERSLRSENT